MSRSKFRVWFEDVLRPLTGRRTQWPQLLRTLIRDEFNRIREVGRPYAGPAIFIDRDETARDYANRPDQHREDLSVYRLFAAVREHAELSGRLFINNEPIWLVTCKVPNQGRHRSRAADLLGIRHDGSLVVFECKVASNRNDTPLVALFEGLDYLSHLLIDENFDRLCEGFAAWRSSHVNPEGFAEVQPSLNANHSVMVLAPLTYYEVHRVDARGIEQDWEFLSDRYWPDNPISVRLDFVVCDYEAEPCELLPLKEASA